VGQLQTDYGLGHEWAVAMRGIVRVATGSGIPPIAEILMGSIMAMLKAQKSGDSGLGGLGAGEADETEP
jgi:hypothetical protein